MSQLKNKDFTRHCPCATTTTDYNGLTVKVNLSIDSALFNVINDNPRDMFDYKVNVCVHERRHKAPAQLIVTKFISWNELKAAPSEMEWDLYHMALDVRTYYENTYKNQLKDELLKKYYDKRQK